MSACPKGCPAIPPTVLRYLDAQSVPAAQGRNALSVRAGVRSDRRVVWVADRAPPQASFRVVSFPDPLGLRDGNMPTLTCWGSAEFIALPPRDKEGDCEAIRARRPTNQFNVGRADAGGPTIKRLTRRHRRASFLSPTYNGFFPNLMAPPGTSASRGASWSDAMRAFDPPLPRTAM